MVVVKVVCWSGGDECGGGECVSDDGRYGVVVVEVCLKWCIGWL